jgi:hypothetical protein
MGNSEPPLTGSPRRRRVPQPASGQSVGRSREIGGGGQATGWPFCGDSRVRGRAHPSPAQPYGAAGAELHPQRTSCSAGRFPCSAPVPIREGPGGFEALAKRMPRRWLNLAPTLSPALPLTPKGSSNTADAPSGGLEDNDPPSGASPQKAQMSLWPVLLSSNYFYGGFKLGRFANNKRRAALQ